MTPQLSLNLGIRWEYNSPVIDKYNHLATFDPNVSGDIRVATSQDQNLYTAKKTQFAPRFGFAYTPFGNKTVFRGGYGIYWDAKLLNILLSPALNPPFVDAAHVHPRAATAYPTSTSRIPMAELPGFLPKHRRGSKPVQERVYPAVELQHPTPVPSDMGLTIGYVGSKERDLDREYNDNLPQPSPLFNQANRPYPSFDGYHSRFGFGILALRRLQISVEKNILERPELSRGLHLLKIDRRRFRVELPRGRSGSTSHTERGPVDFRHPQPLRSSATFTSCRSEAAMLVLAHMNRAGESVLGDWQTNGIFTVQSGNPIDPSVGLLTLTGTNSATRPDVVAGCNPNNFAHTPREWFNTACFSDAFLGRFGDAGRDIIIGPGVFEFRWSLFKNFVFKETRYIQFRGEFFNVLNHPNFDNPTATETSATFGQESLPPASDPATDLAADPVRSEIGVLDESDRLRARDLSTGMSLRLLKIQVKTSGRFQSCPHDIPRISDYFDGLTSVDIAMINNVSHITLQLTDRTCNRRMHHGLAGSISSTGSGRTQPPAGEEQ